MATLCSDFGCSDHIYQMDGVFHGASSWGEAPIAPPPAPPANCSFGPPIPDTYLKGCTAAPPCANSPTLAAAQAACVADARCGGVTLEGGVYQLRAGTKPLAYAGETSWVLGAGCRQPPVDPGYLARGRAAYAGVSRADPDATWLWQGWALNVMARAPKPAVVAQFRGFASAPPPGKFLWADMGIHGSDPQWAQWGIGDAPFLFTALETFGGNLAIKGNLSKLGAALPWAALAANASGLSGVGYTPEGFDQNPPVYELIEGASFAGAPPPPDGAAAWLVRRAQRRYGLAAPRPSVTAAWTALARSGYNLDLGVQDGTSVGRFDSAPFALDGTFWTPGGAPTAALCGAWTAWGALIEAGRDPAVDAAGAPFTYDLVNAGREVLAQLSSPAALNFSRALAEKPLAAPRLAASGGAYAGLLHTLDGLLATDAAFLLGPWVASARAWGANASDCGGGLRGDISCADFYEWNARAQLTTWYPPLNRSLAGAVARDGDYARKHWAGLVGGFYATRVEAALGVALRDAAAGAPLNSTALAEALAVHAWDWVIATDPLPLGPVGDPVEVAAAARAQVAPFFATCL
jgi:alpha-N-acetylglucosaminidase